MIQMNYSFMFVNNQFSYFLYTSCIPHRIDEICVPFFFPFFDPYYSLENGSCLANNTDIKQSHIYMSDIYI